MVSSQAKQYCPLVTTMSCIWSFVPTSRPINLALGFFENGVGGTTRNATVDLATTLAVNESVASRLYRGPSALRRRLVVRIASPRTRIANTITKAGRSTRPHLKAGFGVIASLDPDACPGRSFPRLVSVPSARDSRSAVLFRAWQSAIDSQEKQELPGNRVQDSLRAPRETRQAKFRVRLSG